MPESARGPAVLAAVLTLVTSGCLSPRADPSVFLVLTAAGPAAGEAAPASPGSPFRGATLGVGPVTLPPYLERPQLVTRQDATELSVHPHARWSAPLGLLLSEALGEHLIALVGLGHAALHPWSPSAAPSVSVRVTVQQFEPVVPDAAVLRARWEVLDAGGGRVGEAHSASYRVGSGPTPREAALALSELVAMLARDVAAALR
jgi:uncharacterized protein